MQPYSEMCLLCVLQTIFSLTAFKICGNTYKLLFYLSSTNILLSNNKINNDTYISSLYNQNALDKLKIDFSLLESKNYI